MSMERQVRKQSLLMAERGDELRASDLYEMGFKRTTVNNALTKLVTENRLIRHGHAKSSYYTAVERDTAPIVIPELPKLVLDWMGYTNQKPKGARKVQGILSRGAES